jgi:hypothetical protein
MDEIFVPSPLQSQVLAEALMQVPEPVLFAHIGTDTVTTRKREAENYAAEVLHTRQRHDDIASFEDLRQANDFVAGCQVASLVPALSRATQGLAEQYVLAAIAQLGARIDAVGAQLGARIDAVGAQLDARIDAIDGQLGVLRDMMHNSTASEDNDDLIPPCHGGAAVPDDFPRTVNGLRTLTNRHRLDAVLNYYGLGTDGTAAEKRKRIRRSYGVGVTTTMVTTTAPVVNS